jgi:molecular chaperone HscB
MPAAFLMQQMQWREALDEAAGPAAIEQLDDEVSADERTMLESLRHSLDDQQDAAAAAQQVRALMFVARFRNDIRRRLDALDV